MRYAALLVVLILLVQVAPTKAQAVQPSEPIPTWLSWKVFYDSLAFYSQKSAGQDEKVLTDTFNLSPTQAATLLSAGQSFVAEIQRIDEEARQEAKKRYRYVPAQTGAPPPGGPKRRQAAPQKTIREQALEDGLYAQVEAKKKVALANHMKDLGLNIEAKKLKQIGQFVETSIASRIKRSDAPFPAGDSSSMR
jgi:hypothetical protein